MQNGILPQKGGRYALRVVGSCGVFTPDALRAAALVAERCGGGRVTATSRGTLEIDRIPAERLDEAVALAGELGLKWGGTGATVRAVTACKGTDCRRGVFDTHRLALQLDRAFFGTPAPKKFKIGVYGCPNSLGKARGQDVGILPAPGEAGRFLLFVGGMMGRRPRLGDELGFALPESALVEAVGRILAFYRRHGAEGQRLGDLLEEGGAPLLDRLRAELKELA